MTAPDHTPLAKEEVEEQKGVQVPGPEDTSILTAEPTGAVHGDEETVERAGSTET